MPKSVSKLPISNVLIAGLVTACLAGGGMLYLLATAKVPLATPVTNTLVSATPTAVSRATAIPSPVIPLQGTVKLIAKDLGLFTSQLGGGIPVTIKYYDAGVIKAGSYAGYMRIVAVESPLGPGGPLALLFATQDNQTYILDTDSLPYYMSPRPVFKDLISQINLNSTKVLKEAKLVDEPLSEVKLSPDISLRPIGYQVETFTTPSKNNDGNFDTYYALETDFSKLSALKSPLLGYTAYYEPIGTANSQIQVSDIASAYSLIILVDDQGLATRLEFENHIQANSTDPAGKSMKGGVLEFSGDKIATLNSSQLYSVYGATHIGCGSGGLTEIAKDVSPTDLILAGTSGSTELYRFINPSNKLSHLAYNYKFDGNSSDEQYALNNNGLKRPTFTTYASKNPALLFKDYWGRYVSLTEEQYPWVGGCGKPVVYLYPTKPTDVSLSFTGPIKLDVNIPTYDNGWKVLAQPDGTLTDLQSATTDCRKLPVSRFGAEYAAAACQSKTYPYIFWSGSAGTGQTASRSDGWTVSSAQLKESLEAQLVTAGLKEQERSDMLSYWVPTMLKKNAPYYRFAFLQTAEMNRIAPMQVNPRPDTTYRLFLTWSPEQSLPLTPLQPEFLPHLIRKGFTLVEWGGLER